MRSESPIHPSPTRLVRTRIPDSWAWMRPDILARLLPFAGAYALAYRLTGGARWLGFSGGRIDAQLLFGVVAAPVMFVAAVGVQLWLARRRGALSVPADAGDAWFQAAFYALNGPLEEGLFRGLVQGALGLAWGTPAGFVIATAAYV